MKAQNLQVYMNTKTYENKYMHVYMKAQKHGCYIHIIIFFLFVLTPPPPQQSMVNAAATPDSRSLLTLVSPMCGTERVNKHHTTFMECFLSDCSCARMDLTRNDTGLSSAGSARWREGGREGGREEGGREEGGREDGGRGKGGNSTLSLSSKRLPVDIPCP